MLLNEHKIAVYRSTVLYNRHLLNAKVLIDRNRRSNRSVCIRQFGLVLIGKDTVLYIFQCKEDNLGQVTTW